LTGQVNTYRFGRLAVVLSCCFVLLYVCFALYYTGHSRTELLADFLGPEGCLYRQQKFVSQTFTEGLKQKGNAWSLLGVPLAVFFCWSLCHMHLHLQVPGLLRAIRQSAPWLLALLALCAGLAAYGYYYNALCTDEAFSALNFAEQPLRQLIAYYPLPNNHVLFNLLNHFAAAIWGNAFHSGRALSILFYCILSCANFLLFYHFTRNRFVAFLCSGMLALQFIIWGFGHQGRGYALCFLLQWGGFFSFYSYFFTNRQDRQQMLALLLFCNIVGIWTVPVYLYLVMFQCCSVLLLMIRRRTLYLRYWYMMMLSGAGVCLVYLPLFCYSGFHSIFGGYDTGQPFSELWHLAKIYFYNVVSLQTFNFLDLLKPLATVLFLAPFVLWGIFRKRLKRYSGLLFLYVMLWSSLFLMSVMIRHLPVMRGIGFHMHFSLLLLLLMVATLVEQLPRRNVLRLVFAGVVALCGIRMFHYNKEFSPADLYGQNTRAFFNSLQAMPQDFPPDARIWLSDESFMWPYILKDRSRVDLYDCNFREQQIIFLSEDDKPLPEHVMQSYHLRAEAGWYKIYERNK
jgi:hypothetical protein